MSWSEQSICDLSPCALLDTWLKLRNVQFSINFYPPSTQSLRRTNNSQLKRQKTVEIHLSLTLVRVKLVESIFMATSIKGCKCFPSVFRPRQKGETSLSSNNLHVYIYDMPKKWYHGDGSILYLCHQVAKTWVLGFIKFHLIILAWFCFWVYLPPQP